MTSDDVRLVVEPYIRETLPRVDYRRYRMAREPNWEIRDWRT